MKKLIKILTELSIQYPLCDSFKWDFPEYCPLELPSDISSTFEKNIYLKNNLSPLLEVNNLTNRYWVIQEWGGITSLKKNEKNDNLITKLDSELDIGTLTRPIFSIISSLSKVASFIDHTKYAIYDSRVIYSLNWLLFKYSETTEFYPQPSGRNSKLSEFELNTILNLSGRQISYIEHKTAYHDYCNLLKHLSLEVYGKYEPYHIEMLLFTIAPNYIVDDIKNSISLSINMNKFIATTNKLE